MDRPDPNSRQSSLPSSLIPHLYTAPQQPRDSSTRTTLDREDHPHQHPVSPVFPHLSLYNAPYSFSPEGEPGPSSLLHQRRGSSQPPGRVADVYSRHEPYGPMRESERDTYWPPAVQHSVHYNIPQHTASSSSHTFQGLPSPQQLLIPGSEATSSSFTFDRHDAYTYPPVGALSMSAPTTAHIRNPDSLEIPQSMHYHHRSDSRSGDDGGDSQKGKRRRAESLETDDNGRKARNHRKTAVACNFCRGRKLRCDGAKPSCYNCTVRKFECEYVPIQRRRGPGKAPKGSRSKKATSSRSDPSKADRPPSAVPEYELDALAPELRPYTSVLSLDTFGFQLPPHYPSVPDPPHYYSRTRSRETSSEDRSDAEERYR